MLVHLNVEVLLFNYMNNTYQQFKLKKKVYSKTYHINYYKN